MFEKNAQSYAFDEVNHKQQWYIKHPEHSIDGDYEDIKKHWGKGAEFGYNKAKEDADKMKSRFIELCNLKDMRIAELEKANEWHYVKDGDLPKDDKEYLVLYYFNYKGKKETHCGVRDNLHNDFEIHRCYTEQIIAWKEIVLPELKESK